MATLSFAEENYLKCIYHLSGEGSNTVSTNGVAEMLNTKPASVSDMLKRLSQKQLIDYEKYQGVQISEKGKKAALRIIRKHRLWEVFLVDKLSFNWDEVHEVAEQLEHIHSPLLIERLDEFLNHPQYDPHGDPIPDANGKMPEKAKVPLNEMKKGSHGKVANVNDSSPEFLQYLDKLGIFIGAEIEVIDVIQFDGSMEILLGDKKLFISEIAGKNILMFKK